ncbi:hypothetical protein SCATT_19130 [Streptantibioticus cattleyicolor NRRL 8057 = DSM 46488]|uniref:Uncharacterized protein n=1 Tax=Streptantibioticus cattleyicolor (strain ATCC 35852 / DSM 46488 / JCM 4925 / NBRC 14057 / NRRL 8057) TaxID=1003195 RepID=G8WTU0_STREN|nr:hypothetical protein SCATT_19130 [Streptantibioticus cattleyicolor NRRL 8057 = DSM 46488]
MRTPWDHGRVPRTGFAVRVGAVRPDAPAAPGARVCPRNPRRSTA